jgi:hypothetical protein
MHRVALSVLIGLLLVLSLSVGGAAGGGGGSFVVGDGLADGEIGGGRAATVTWSGTAWPEPVAGDFAPYAFCQDVEFFVNGDSGFERRLVLEFPLAELPAGATITSATLGMMNATASSTGGFLVSGFAGNGAIDNADGVAGATSLPFPAMPLGGTGDWDVTSQMSAAMVASGWAGFTIWGSFDRTVHGANGYPTSHRVVCPGFQQVRPTLTIVYDVAAPTPVNSLQNAAMAVPPAGQPLTILGMGFLALAALLVTAAVGVRIRARY